MNLDDALKFKQVAIERGLLLDEGTKEQHHVFDLNMLGLVYTPIGISKVWDLVRLAREYSPSDDYGIHHTLLNQYTGRERLREASLPEQPSILWNRYFSKGMVSLQQILEENGYHMSELEKE